MSNIAFVLGNGESRKGIQIEDLKLHISKGEIKLSKAELKKAIRKINNTIQKHTIQKHTQDHR